MVDELMAMNVVNAETKRVIADSLKAASNPDHGKVSVIVKSLPADRQRLIGKTARAMQSITDDVMARGKAKLMDMSQDEWDALIENE